MTDTPETADARAREAFVREVISMYHTTRMGDVPAEKHILSKPSVQKAWATLRAALQSPPVAGGSVGEDEQIPSIGVRALNLARCLAQAEFRSDLDRCVDEAKAIMSGGPFQLAALAKPTPPASGSGEVVTVPIARLQKIADAYDDWDRDANFAAMVLCHISTIAEELLAAAPEAATPSAVGGVDRLREAEALVAAKRAGSREESEYRLEEIRSCIRKGGDSWGVADWDDVRDYVFNAAKARAALTTGETSRDGETQ